jgi:hypothetical protein
MREHRRTSLLDFAIVASIAVFPVLTGIIVMVAILRPADPEQARRVPADRYISVRHMAALETFEAAITRRTHPPALPPTAAQLLAAIPACEHEWKPRWATTSWMRRTSSADASSVAEQIASGLAEFDAALLRFSSRPNSRVAHSVGFDAARWFTAVNRSLVAGVVAPDSSDGSSASLRMRCADLPGALAALSRADFRMLDTLEWRGTVGSATLARWRADQDVGIPPRQMMRRNPWDGIAGCIYLGRAADTNHPTHFVAAARSPASRVCNQAATSGTVRAGSTAADTQTGPPSPTALAALPGEPGLADAADDPRWMVPPSLYAMLAPLETLRQPTGVMYRMETDRTEATAASRPNRIVLDGAAVDVGFSIDITIDPALQALAQKTAACYTGRHDVCRTLRMRRSSDRERPVGDGMLEGAMVRMAAVAVIDVESGRIEALAGALSRCARQEVDGPGRDADCDARLPYAVQYRPDALLNPAVFHDAMPASTIKPIMAASFLADPRAGGRWLAAERAAIQRNIPPARNSLRGELMRSDSARFLDRMFCIDSGFANCRRPWDVQASARLFGWNAGCLASPAGAGADAQSGCGQHDLLFGRVVNGITASRPALPVTYGRLMTEPLAGTMGAAMRLRPPASLDAGIVARCALGADGRRLNEDDWAKCKGGAVVDVVAEGWGQGHARASALGVAGMMATLAAAANGQATVRAPHLVETLRGVATGAHQVPRAAVPLLNTTPLPNPLARESAETILNGLSYSHRVGTARTACEQVFDATRCRGIDWLAGKTGTPSFPNDGIPLDELARLCPSDTAVARPQRHAAPPAARSKEKPVACSSLRPYKWYTAVWRGDANTKGPWTKAIAVLTERNWIRQSGQVHGAGDHGPNPSAEIAMQIAGRRVGAIAVASSPTAPSAPPTGDVARALR